MESVQRYNHGHFETPHPEGKWVKYEDYKSLKELCDSYAESLDKIHTMDKRLAQMNKRN